MKRIIAMVFLLFILLIPVDVDALSIQGTSLKGGTVISNEGAFSLSFQVHFSGIQNDRADILGIQVVSYELRFDDSVFRVASVTSDDWNSKILYEDGGYFIYSEVKEYTSSQNLCVNQMTYCGDYDVKINFVTKDMSRKSSDIQIGEVLAIFGHFNMDAPPRIGSGNSEPVSNTVLATSNQKQTIYFKKDESGKENVPENSSSPVSPSPNIDSTPSGGSERPDHSVNSVVNPTHNSDLKSLEVENYSLDFEKTKKLYRLTVDDKVNQLKIHVVPEYEKATYQIIGADDLAAHQNIVTIEVMAEDGSKNHYTIQVQHKGAIVSTEKKSKKFKIDSKYWIIGGVGVVILVVIAIFIHYISNRKIDKALDKF